MCLGHADPHILTVLSNRVHQTLDTGLRIEKRVDTLDEGLRTRLEAQTNELAHLRSSVVPEVQSHHTRVNEGFISLQNAITADRSAAKREHQQMESMMRELQTLMLANHSRHAANNCTESGVATWPLSPAHGRRSGNMEAIEKILRDFEKLWHLNQQGIDTQSQSDDLAEKIIADISTIGNLLSEPSMLEMQSDRQSQSTKYQTGSIQDARQGLTRFRRNFGHLELHMNKTCGF
jgi:hypothetical protein